MQPDKKQLEILIMQYFRESFDDFPKGKVKPSESPDFTTDIKNHHVLGIELTRLNPANARELDVKAIKNINRREELIQSIRGLFEQSSNLKLFVKFLFSEEKTIADERKIMLAIQIVELNLTGVRWFIISNI